MHQTRWTLQVHAIETSRARSPILNLFIALFMVVTFRFAAKENQLMTSHFLRLQPRSSAICRSLHSHALKTEGALV